MNLPDGRAGGEAGRRGGHGVRCSAQGAHQPCLPLHSRCLTKQMLPYLPRPCAAPRPTPAAPPARRAPPGVGLAAGLEQGQQHWVVLVAAVVQGLLVQVGEQLHALGTARGGLDTRPPCAQEEAPPRSHTQPGSLSRSPAGQHSKNAQLTVGNAALGSPQVPIPQSSAKYLDGSQVRAGAQGLRSPRPG